MPTLSNVMPSSLSPSYTCVDVMVVKDFRAGAMENWGLIIYREDIVLYNPSVDTYNHKQWLAGIIAHEQSHQVREGGGNGSGSNAVSHLIMYPLNVYNVLHIIYNI